MEKGISEEHLKFFTNKLLEHHLQTCSPSVSINFIQERAENATMLYLSLTRSGKEPTDALQKAYDLLFSK